MIDATAFSRSSGTVYSSSRSRSSNSPSNTPPLADESRRELGSKQKNYECSQNPKNPFDGNHGVTLNKYVYYLVMETGFWSVNRGRSANFLSLQVIASRPAEAHMLSEGSVPMQSSRPNLKNIISHFVSLFHKYLFDTWVCHSSLDILAARPCGSSAGATPSCQRGSPVHSSSVGP